MKRKIKYTLNLLAICLCTGIIFTGSGYLYLNRELEPAENKTESVPYYSPAPESKGIMFDICGDRTLCYMDFESKAMSLIFDEYKTPVGETLYGYPVDYLIEGNYELFAGIIDIAEGVDLELSGETLRYTGVQIADILSRTSERKDLRKEIITQILGKIEKSGFQKKDFLFIIENSQTELTVPDCYYWSDYISDLCGNYQIINASP